MLRNEAVARVQRGLGFRTDLVDVIIEELGDAQRLLEGGILTPSGGTFLPWFLQTEVSSTTEIVDEVRVPLPEDFLRECEEDALWLQQSDGTWKALWKDDLDWLRREYPGTGAPVGYALDGGYFRLFPKPDAMYVISMMYYAADVPITSGADMTNKWLTNAPFLLIAEAGKSVAADTRSTAALQRFSEKATLEARRLFISNEAREHENRRYVMGGPQ